MPGLTSCFRRATDRQRSLSFVIARTQHKRLALLTTPAHAYSVETPVVTGLLTEWTVAAAGVQRRNPCLRLPPIGFFQVLSRARFPGRAGLTSACWVARLIPACSTSVFARSSWMH